MNSDRLSVFDDVYNQTHQLLSGQPVVVGHYPTVK